MSELSISNVFEVSVSAPGVGVSEMNTSNLAIITNDPYANSFGTSGFKIYVDPREAAIDFGTASNTSKMVSTIFSQRPNIRAGNGYAVVIPMLSKISEILFDKVPTSGTLVLEFNGADSAPISYNATAAQIQAIVRAVDPVEYKDVIVTGTMATSILIDWKGVTQEVIVMGGASTLQNAGAVVVTIEIDRAFETPQAALIRAADLVNFFGVLYTQEFDETELLAVAAALAPMRKIGFFLGSTEADNEDDGKLDMLRQNGFTNSRGLLRIDTVPNGLIYTAAYASRGLSVDFSGVNTTMTIHLKDLVGISGDGNIDQNIKNQAAISGADIYANFDRNVSKIMSSGGNDYFDNVYNILSYVDALQVAGFNLFAQTPTKIPQTEGGMDLVKGSMRKVCEQYVRNGFISPGEWTSPTTFGPLDDFLDNIRQRGYYIYAAPISQQSVADREARKAPLVQIAIKYAGAFHSGSILVTINE